MHCSRRYWQFAGVLSALLIFSLVSVAMATDATTPPVGWDRQQWLAALQSDRAERDRQFAAGPTSMLAAIDQVRHVSGAPLAFDVTPTGMGRSASSATQNGIIFSVVGSRWEWQPVAIGSVASYRGQSAQPGALEPGMRIELQGRYLFLIFSAKPDDLQFGVFDLRSRALQSFNGLVYYPPDEKYLVNAELKRSQEGAIVGLRTAGSATREFSKVGTLRFELNGTAASLVAYKERADDSWLYIPFRDATSGEETFGAGRFMTIEDPGTEELLLDFNRAMNSPCAYSPGFDCLQTPAENSLTVAIAAGEKAYPLPE